MIPPAFSKKTIAAPEWFIDLWDRSHKAADEAADTLGVGIHWLKQAKPENAIEKIRSLPIEKQRRYNTQIQYHHLTHEMLWMLMRYINLDGDLDIANAEQMTYDPETKQITVKRGMFIHFAEKLRQTAREIFNP